MSNFNSKSRNIPFTGAVSVPVSDSAAVNLVDPVRGFYVNAEGDIVFVCEDLSVGTVWGAQPGTLYPFEIRRVVRTGTAAAITAVTGGY